MDHVEVGGLKVAKPLHDFVRHEALPGTGLDPATFWTGFGAVVHDLAPANRALLQKRDEIQAQIDAWHKANTARPVDMAAYRAFLTGIGYLEPEPARFTITTADVDPEIATLAGPQLVVPITNARYALNAANARWGSLYDALYGTDAIPEDGGAERGRGLNPTRAARVVERAKAILDEVAPLTAGSHAAVTGYAVRDGALAISGAGALRDPSQFRGYRGAADAPTAILIRHHGLHVELLIDRAHPIGKNDPAGVADVILESALSTIMDCEDSVAAVDTEDKVAVYRNWLGLCQGTLTASFEKGGRTLERRLEPDREYTAPDGGTLTVPGRSLMLIRTVGHHMMTDSVLDRDGQPIPENLLDGVVTSLIALHDLRSDRPIRNSRAGSVYIVKPKMHGPSEVAFANGFFDRVEDLLGLARHTLKMGIMDEERRTSAWCARTTCAPPPGSVRTRTRTSISASPAGCAAGRRSARACGPHPTGWRRCWSRRSAIHARARTPPGCRHRPPRRCTRCIIIRSMWPSASRRSQAARRPRSTCC